MKAYKTTCPKCLHDSLYVTPRNGLQYCFRASCHYIARDGTQTYQKQERSKYIQEIRQLYTDVAHYYHSALTPEAIRYLYSRGFTDSTIKQYKLGYCPSGTHPLYKSHIAEEAGLAIHQKAFLAHRITFPYITHGKIVTDIRARAIDPDEELRYKSPFGGVYYRGAIYPYNYSMEQDQPVLLTEGEIKALIAQQYGFPTIALPGITSWRKGFIPKQKVIVVFDTERKPDTQLDIRAAICTLHTYIEDLYVAVLPLDYNKPKAELDTFLLQYGPNLLQSLLTNALSFEQWNALQSF